MAKATETKATAKATETKATAKVSVLLGCNYKDGKPGMVVSLSKKEADHLIGIGWAEKA